MKITLHKLKLDSDSTLVIFVGQEPKSKKVLTSKLPADLAKCLADLTHDEVFKGDKKEVSFLRNANLGGCKNVLWIGLGEKSQIDAEALRVASAVTLGALKAAKVTNTQVWLDTAAKFVKAEVAVGALTEGFMLSSYDFDELKSKPKDDGKKSKKPKLESIALATSAAPAAGATKALKRAEILAECQNFARRLGDLPGSHMNPTLLAEETQKAAKGTGVKVTVWDKARIKKERMGGLLAVAAGSSQEPRFIIMEYKGAPASKKPVCFVGKGLTFDSGGISIKPSQSMEEMKYDMCGGANVIATILALAKLKAKVNVIGLVPSTENMPGPAATKPGDIYVARNGKTVEVHNTDAEGRLILGEALVYGSEQKPVAMFDAATLTGAILISLGNTHTGVFTRDNKLMQRIQKAADQTGELVWGLPLVDFHKEDMKGTHADLCNISGGRLAGSSTAAAFLEEFVENDVPWAHFDIAGTAWSVAGRFPYHPKKSASGIMVRTFVELAESYF